MNKIKPKINKAQREQHTLEAIDWANLVDSDHIVRRIMAVISKIDLKELYGRISSKEGERGRPAIDPILLLCIWIYAATRGFNSSRRIAEYCEWEPGFRWILGQGLHVKHVTLSTFRKKAGECLDRILTQVVTSMAATGLISLDEIILDGTKIKANAGKGSFHTKTELELLYKEVSEKLENLKKDDQNNVLKKYAQGIKDRIDQAAKMVPVVQKACDETAKKKKRGSKAVVAKVSTTDAEARYMRFSDGALAPGYNAQFITTSDYSVIVGVRATTRRNDTNLMRPMLDEFKDRFSISTKRILVDSGYTVQQDIEAALYNKVEVYGSIKKETGKSTVASQKRLKMKRLKESDVMKNWRIKMETPEAKDVRKRRSRTEKVHGWIKQTMGWQFRLRGLIGAQIELTLMSIGYNFKRLFNMTEPVH